MPDERIKVLLIQHLNNDLDSLETEELFSWVNNNPENKRFYSESKLLHSFYKNSNRVPDFKKNEVWEQIQSRISPEKSNIRQMHLQRIFKVTRNAAAILFIPLLIGFGMFYTYQKSVRDAVGETVLNTLTTPKGSKAYISLSDGTHVWLNADSKLTYPSNFDLDTRTVALTGEAFFDVAKKNNASFIVQTSDIQIKATGTSFNIKSFPNEGVIETVLIDGEVKINQIDSQNQPQHNVVLKPNQKAIYIKPQGDIYHINNMDIVDMNKLKGKIIVTDTRNTDIETAWTDNRLVFRDEKFSSLAIKMERWYNVKINIQNETIKAVKFSGTFESETVEMALYALSRTNPFKYTIARSEITIY